MVFNSDSCTLPWIHNSSGGVNDLGGWGGWEGVSLSHDGSIIWTVCICGSLGMNWISYFIHPPPPPRRWNAKPPVNQSGVVSLLALIQSGTKKRAILMFFAWSSSARCGSHKGAHIHTDRGGWFASERLTATRTRAHRGTHAAICEHFRRVIIERIRTFESRELERAAGRWVFGKKGRGSVITVWVLFFPSTLRWLIYKGLMPPSFARKGTK